MGHGDPFPLAFSPSHLYTHPAASVYLCVNTGNLLPRSISFLRVKETNITALFNRVRAWC